MSVDVSAVTNHFPTANKGFITTTSSTFTSGVAQTTVPLTSVSGLTNGSIFVGILAPGTTSEREFTGTVDTAGSQITGVKWTDGSDATHTAGTTIVDYVSATGQKMQTKGILVEHNQDGTHDEALITSRTEDTAPDPDADYVLTYDTSALALKKAKIQNLQTNSSSWISNVMPAPNTVTYNGNRSYDLTFNSTDLTGYISPGMRLRTSRTVAAPTYMGGLLNGSSQYFTKVTPSGTLGTVTDNFTIMAWVQPTTYQDGYICGRMDATPNNGFAMAMLASGQVRVTVFNAATANFRRIDTYQSLPLNKRTHVTASWASGTVVIYFDGVSVPVQAATTGGTAPTTAGAGGDFSIGRAGALNATYFTGYISNVGVFNTVLSAATIRSYIPQVLSGSETNCIGAWSLNNVLTDSNAAGNNLSAGGSASFTAISPYASDASNVAGGTYDYAIVQKAVYSGGNTTLTVQVPEGCAIPTSGGVSAVAYSSVKAPFGMTTSTFRWSVTNLTRTDFTQNPPTANTLYQALGHQINSLGTGDWLLAATGILEGRSSTSGLGAQVNVMLSTSTSSQTNFDLVASMFIGTSGTSIQLDTPYSIIGSMSFSEQTSLYILVQATSATTNFLSDRNSYSAGTITAIPSNL